MYVEYIKTTYSPRLGVMLPSSLQPDEQEENELPRAPDLNHSCPTTHADVQYDLCGFGQKGLAPPGHSQGARLPSPDTEDMLKSKYAP